MLSLLTLRSRTSITSISSACLNSRLILSGVLGEVPISLFFLSARVCVWVFHSFPWATHTQTQKFLVDKKKSPPKNNFFVLFLFYATGKKCLLTEKGDKIPGSLYIGSGQLVKTVYIVVVPPPVGIIHRHI